MRVHLMGSGRQDKIRQPLNAVNVECVAYQGLSTFRNQDVDLMVTDVPGTTLLKAAMFARLVDVPLVYRMRGNYWQELRSERLAGLRAVLSDKIVFPQCDIICPTDQRLTKMVETRTRFEGTTCTVSIPKNVSNYPVVEHNESKKNLITLTNLDYRAKIEPIYEFLDPVNNLLAEHNAMWNIGGRGQFAEEFQDNLEGYEHINYVGFVNPAQYLQRSAVMIHISGFDSAPNAILEGMAAGLPVVVNAHEALQQIEQVHVVETGHELGAELERLLESPSLRDQIGDANREYVKNNHNYEFIGNQFERCFNTVLTR